MACITEFTIEGITVTTGSLTETYQISRELIAEGVSTFRAASGIAWLDVLWQKTRYTITGAGPADPALWGIDLTLATWTVSIPGFADQSAGETWIVVPARPTQTKDRISGKHSWSLVLDQAD
jgi:hypothetical protein